MLLLFFTAFSWLCVIYVIYMCVLLVLILLLDCDLILKFYEHWGRKPEATMWGKVAWVTGASSGIGEELAYQLARSGVQLVLSARGEKGLKRVAEKCKGWLFSVVGLKSGVFCLLESISLLHLDLSPANSKNLHMVLPMDMLETSCHEEKTAQVLKQFAKIDVLVNNAGRSQRAVALDTNLEVDKALVELNTISTLSLTRAVLPHMIKQKDGQIVVISSVAGVIGAPGSASYSASKHALHGFFDTLRMEIADTGVNVHVVCPGPVDTPYRESQFGTTLHKGPEVEKSEKKDTTRVSAERCAYLILVAITNRLDQVWISKNPILLFVYLAQYAPNLTNWLGKWLGNKRAKAVKAGKHVIDDVFFKKNE